MKKQKDILKRRITYYDHEPAYKALEQRGEKAWKSEGKTAPFSRHWRIFNATGFLPKPAARVLDFGCGGGQFSVFLAKKGYEVIGVDYSKTAIKMAKENAKKANMENLKYYRRDALNPRLRSSHFDAVFSIAVLHCLIGKDRMIYWSNANKVLKKGGVIALTSMVDFPKDKKFMKQLKINKKTRTDARRTRYFASEKEILNEAKSANLDVLYYARRKDIEDEKGCDDFIIIAQKKI